MGAFFTSVQVRSADLDGALATLRADADAVGMDEHEGDEALADRTVLVLPPDEGGWIGVYDQATESQDGAALERVAAALSRALGTHAFTILVHDGDVLDLRLFEHGERLDHYDSWPEYFGGRRHRREALSGAPAAWAALSATRDEDAFRAAFAGEELFAERGLSAIARLVGLDPRRAHTGYRYLLGDGALGAEAPFLEPRTLRFRLRERPAWEAPAEGPPALTLQAHPGDAPLRGAVCDALRLGVSATSTGGASRGLRIMAWGSALDAGLVELDAFELVLGRARGIVQRPRLEPRSGRDAQGHLLRFAEVPDAEVPAGARAAMPVGGDVMAFVEAQLARQAHVSVVGRFLRAGHGELSVGLVPLANLDGAAGTTMRLEVSEPLRRPLRAGDLAGMPGGSSHLLRPLAEDRFWIALAPIDAPLDEVATLAQGAVEALAALLPPARVETTTFRVEPGARPRTGKGKGLSLLRGKRLATLAEAMRQELTVGVRTWSEDVEPGPERSTAPGWGMLVGRGMLPDRLDARIPTLAISVERASLDPAADARVRAWLEETLARAAALGALSATLTRAGEALSPSPDFSPYETACRIQGPVTSTRAWCRRWLRVPGDAVTWLSAELASHLDEASRRALDACADVDALPGGGLRIRLRARDAIGELEHALAAILPSASDAQAALMAWYRQDP